MIIVRCDEDDRGAVGCDDDFGISMIVAIGKRGSQDDNGDREDECFDEVIVTMVDDDEEGFKS